MKILKKSRKQYASKASESSIHPAPNTACTPRKQRPAKNAGQAGQAGLGFVRFVGEVRAGAAAGTPLRYTSGAFPANSAGTRRGPLAGSIFFNQVSHMEVPMSEQVTIELLKGFLEAFNLHDLDSIMGYFADDCVFYMPRGAKPRGDQYVGKKEVRAGLAKRFEGIPDVHYGDDQHWICGDFGVSEWTLTGTSTSGQHIEVRGVDLLEFAQGKVIRKDSFWKILE